MVKKMSGKQKARIWCAALGALAPTILATAYLIRTLAVPGKPSHSVRAELSRSRPCTLRKAVFGTTSANWTSSPACT